MQSDLFEYDCIAHAHDTHMVLSLVHHPLVGDPSAAVVLTPRRRRSFLRSRGGRSTRSIRSWMPPRSIRGWCSTPPYGATRSPPTLRRRGDGTSPPSGSMRARGAVHVGSGAPLLHLGLVLPRGAPRRGGVRRAGGGVPRGATRG